MDNLSEFEYVGFWPRVWASCIDTVLLMAVSIPILFAIYGRDYFASDSMIKGPADFIISFIFPAVAVIVFWNIRHATPGKMAIGAKIVDEKTGRAPSTGQHIGRYLGYFVSIFPACIGLIWVGLDPKKQGWHDKLAGTVVIRERNRHAEPVRFE